MKDTDERSCASRGSVSVELEDGMKWIPVRERLPEPGARVVIFCPLLSPEEIIGATRYMINDDGWCVWVTDDGQDLGDTEPTHWMPFPGRPTSDK
jgi:hypothetical protein